MLTEIFRAEQALFFGGDGGKQNGARWSGLGTGPYAGKFEKNSAAGGVVNRAMINVVALRASLSIPK